MKVTPTLAVNLHSSTGRGFFQLDLTSMTEMEMRFMNAVFEKSGQGVEFGVGESADGRPVLQFTIGKASVQ